MSAPKPLLVLLFPAIFAAPLALSTLAHAQEKTAANPDSKAAPRASLTAPARPASTIAPRQNLPAFTSVKATISPVLATPTATATAPASAPTSAKGQAITPPVPVQAGVKEAALPATQQRQPLAALSIRERSKLVTPAPVAATPPILITRQRRAFAKAVSLSTSPLRAPEPLAPQVPVSPIVTAPVNAPIPVTAIAPLPTVEVAPPVAKPSILASREARARELALARLDAQLAGAEARLDRAQDKLTEGQRQLGSVNQLLQSAMLSSGGSGLHPFVRVAQRYLGTPYVWGGESARGFDCSGFIMRVMRDLGYKALPHSAAEQFNYGKPISKGLLQPGDIVFFANTYKPGISHVGIYLGGGRFIHAANSQVGTIVSNLNESKWVTKYAGARRLMKTS